MNAILLLAATVGVTPPTCAQKATVVEACRDVHGRLQATHGAPSLQIRVEGGSPVLGVAGDEGAELLPDALRERIDAGHTLVGDFRVCPLTPARPGAMQMVCVESGVAAMDGGGPLEAEDQVPALDAIVRYGIAMARPPCVNYGARDAFCLSVHGENPSTALLDRLADVRPRVLSVSACLQEGIVASAPRATDPGVDVIWLRRVADGRVQARIKVYCSVAEPAFRREGTKWTLEGSPGGWVGCGPLPSDCIDAAGE